MAGCDDRVSGTAAPSLVRRRPAAGHARLALPFAAVAGIGLLTVLLPPYERPWWVAGLAAVVLVAGRGGLPREPAPRRTLLARSAGRLPALPLRRAAPRRRRGRRGWLVLGHDGPPPASDPVAGDHRHAAPAVGRQCPGRPHLRHPDRGHRTAELRARGLAPRGGVGRCRPRDRSRPPAHRPRPRAADPPRADRQRAGRAPLRRRPARGRAARPAGHDHPGQRLDGGPGRARPAGHGRSHARAFETPGEDRIQDHLGRLIVQPRGVARHRVHAARLRAATTSRLAQQHGRSATAAWARS